MHLSCWNQPLATHIVALAPIPIGGVEGEQNGMSLVKSRIVRPASFDGLIWLSDAVRSVSSVMDNSNLQKGEVLISLEERSVGG